MGNGVMRKYESMFLVDSAVAASNWDDVVERINTVLKRANAKVARLEEWDERRLCFEIEGRKRGTYILCHFDADPDSIRGIERDVQIDESILRVLILSAERIPEEVMSAPTPAKQAKDREDGVGPEGAVRDRGEPEARSAVAVAEPAEPKQEAAEVTTKPEVEVVSEAAAVADEVEPEPKRVVGEDPPAEGDAEEKAD